MKSANEATINCSQFKKIVSDFIDDELHGSLKRAFLAHAAECKICSLLLNECQAIKRHLGNLSSVGVSKEFDFKLKSTIRMENKRMKNRYYTYWLYMRDRAMSFVLVPAFTAAAIFIAFAGIQTYVPSEYAPQNKLAEQAPVKTADELSIDMDNASKDNIFYILDSIAKSDAEKGFFLEDRSVVMGANTTSSNIKPVSF